MPPVQWTPSYFQDYVNTQLKRHQNKHQNKHHPVFSIKKCPTPPTLNSNSKLFSKDNFFNHRVVLPPTLPVPPTTKALKALNATAAAPHPRRWCRCHSNHQWCHGLDDRPRWSRSSCMWLKPRKWQCTMGRNQRCQKHRWERWILNGITYKLYDMSLTTIPTRMEPWNSCKKKSLEKLPNWLQATGGSSEINCTTYGLYLEDLVHGWPSQNEEQWNAGKPVSYRKLTLLRRFWDDDSRF